MLPVELGKMLILGDMFHCLDPIVTVVAGLSVRDPFLMPLDKKDLAESSNSQFVGRYYSDHLTVVRTYEGLFSDDQNTCNEWIHDEHYVRAVICAGLYPGICSVMNKEKSFSLKTMKDGPVLLYLNSVNGKESSIPYPWLVFNEKVKVNSVSLHDSTPISDSILLLFGVNISKGELDGHSKMLGGYLEFIMKPALADIYLIVKREFDEIIQTKCKDEEVVIVVIAHELGHWKLSHTIYSFIAIQILTLLQFGGYTLVKNSKGMFQSFSFDTQPVLIGLILFQATGR